MSHEAEVSEEFLEGMRNRMYVSYHKYGPVRDAYPSKVNAIDSLLIRLRTYLGEVLFKEACERAQAARSKDLPVGNTEYLMDAANFAMIEFMYPAQRNAFFKATDTDGSPGRIERGNPDPVQYANRDLLPTEGE